MYTKSQIQFRHEEVHLFGDAPCGCVIVVQRQYMLARGCRLISKVHPCHLNFRCSIFTLIYLLHQQLPTVLHISKAWQQPMRTVASSKFCHPRSSLVSSTSW